MEESCPITHIRCAQVGSRRPSGPSTPARSRSPLGPLPGRRSLGLPPHLARGARQGAGGALPPTRTSAFRTMRLSGVIETPSPPSTAAASRSPRTPRPSPARIREAVRAGGAGDAVPRGEASQRSRRHSGDRQRGSERVPQRAIGRGRRRHTATLSGRRSALGFSPAVIKAHFMSKDVA